MSRKQLLTLLAAATLTGCTAPPATNHAPTTPPPSAQLGTVDPAYPVGPGLAPGIEVLETIPVTELSTAEPVSRRPPETCSVTSTASGPAGGSPALHQPGDVTGSPPCVTTVR